eukprot:CAMPEP_0170986132 /NCGR_PEP_ID=MMETSP0736-20130129/5902_1 /TAXON_ID=186038 /ORGANISM="Fragilariopsis kerguelensis, Strain L26-C5" /LENGTH=1039 /DNA_ID=CAMNT_0011410213 /DNA_START=359 /DNA_END=3478 /DNA_ORIENTATION=+
MTKATITTDPKGEVSFSSSSTTNKKKKTVSLLTTLLSLWVAILLGLSCGLFYATVIQRSALLVVSIEGGEVIAPPHQCSNHADTTTTCTTIDDDDDKESNRTFEATTTTTTSGGTTLSWQQQSEQRLEFKYVELEDDDDEAEGEEETKEEEKEGDVVFQRKEGRLPPMTQLFINAYDIDYFEDEKQSDFQNNGDALMTQLLTELLGASEECEEIGMDLYGYYIHSTSTTWHAMGMFRQGRGYVSLTVWPAERKLMSQFFISPIRADEEEENDEEDDEEEDGTKLIVTCMESMGTLLYPHDVIDPTEILTAGGSSSSEEEEVVTVVTHTTQLGPFQALSKYHKDPCRYRWKTGTKRGFQPPGGPTDKDIAHELMQFNTWKHLVVMAESPFQTITIIDGDDGEEDTTPILTSYLELDDDTHPDCENRRRYMEQHPQFLQPDRMLFLDGVIQSTRQGLAAYHEALVQPAMFAHPNPRRVAIVGGGECATLREVLKHNTVDTVVMVEIDPLIVEVSKKYLSEWNDCSMFKNSARYCMDDPRVEMYHVDALGWFRDRFSQEAQLEQHPAFGSEELFDVVILDALDPQNAVDFAELLYSDGPFMNSLYNSLTANGVLLAQVGEAVRIHKSSAETMIGNVNYQRAQYEQGLKKQGFEVVMHYEEARAGFDSAWSFYAAFKDDAIRERWLFNEAQVDLEIHKRSVRRRKPHDTKTEETGELQNLFEVFDGPTMVTYRYPSKASQVVYCLRDPQPYGCITNIHNTTHHPPYGNFQKNARGAQRPYYEPSGFDPDIPNFSIDQFSREGGGVDNNNTNTNNSNQSHGGLVSRVTIPKNSYLMLEQSIHDVRVTPTTSSIVDKSSSSTTNDDDEILRRSIRPVQEFISGSRTELSIPRRGDIHSTYGVDSGLLSFLQHGCDGTFNTVTAQPSLTESTANPQMIPNGEGHEEGDDHQLLVRMGRSYHQNTNDDEKKKETMELAQELVFHPSFTRNSPRPEFVMSSRTIPPGEEISSNSVPWYHPAGWEQHIHTVRAHCEQQQSQNQKLDNNQ